jgi:circadian clock protein KaiB
VARSSGKETRARRPGKAAGGARPKAGPKARAKRGPVQKHVLRLFVAGTTSQSTRAIIAARKLCAEQLAGSYDLEVVDVFQQPLLARADQVVAVPTLVKRLPPPLRRLVGDLSNTERVLVGLDLVAADAGPAAGRGA